MGLKVQGFIVEGLGLGFKVSGFFKSGAFGGDFIGHVWGPCNYSDP